VDNEYIRIYLYFNTFRICTIRNIWSSNRVANILDKIPVFFMVGKERKLKEIIVDQGKETLLYIIYLLGMISIAYLLLVVMREEVENEK